MPSVLGLIFLNVRLSLPSPIVIVYNGGGGGGGGAPSAGWSIISGLGDLNILKYLVLTIL
jgi:hypothetical protein